MCLPLALDAYNTDLLPVPGLVLGLSTPGFHRIQIGWICTCIDNDIRAACVCAYFWGFNREELDPLNETFGG